MFMRGKYVFLSNYFRCKVTYDGITYQNSEAAFQAQKEEDWFDRKSYATLLPGEAKYKGRRAKLRSDWENIKDSVMESVLRAKFSQHFDLSERLKNLKGPIVEDNDWGDVYWGRVGGFGQNKLGEILMKLRKELRDGEFHE